MSTAASSRPHGAEAENPRGQCGGVPQGAHVPGQDPGLAHPQLMPRPLFYVHAPPPPFMHYQWPMPFYNPFNPFSGMGYGMIMPPFPPAPYMDPPTYFVPHAPVQPMDYRRMVHPQPHPQPHPNSATSQNLNPMRRPRPPHSGPIRETVNTEVQTEPRRGELHGESPLQSCSDSGRDTALTSPTSSTSSQKKTNDDVENYNEPNKCLQPKIACTRGNIKPCLPMPSPEGQSMQKSKDNCLESLQSLKNQDVNLVRQENINTLDSPSKDLSKKERRVSVPDILLSWGNGIPQENKTAGDNNENLPCYEDEVENFQSSTVVNEDQIEPETVDSEKDENDKIVEFKSHYEPLEHSLNISIKLCNAGHDTINEPTLEEPLGSAQTPKFRRKLNESIWSVESLPVYVPSKEWLVQNITAGPEAILELQEEAENDAQNVANPKSCNSPTDSVQLSDSFIDFSTPASKVDTNQASNVMPQNSKMQKRMNPLDSPIKLKMPEIRTEEKMVEDAAPAQSPNQRSFTVEEKLDKGKDSNKDKTMILDSEKVSEEESCQKNVVEVGEEQLLVPPLAHTVMERLPSKVQLVDCGVQCPDLQTTNDRKQHPDTADIHNTSSRSDGAVMNGNWQKKRHNQGRNKGLYRPHGHQEVCFDFYNKPGKQRGGKGRY